MKRSSGILMHITSLPGQYGIGTFGKHAYQFVDFLEETEQSYWQILPLTTTGYGDSPYQSFSAVAGNTNLIDFELLEQEGFLERQAFENENYGENLDKVDFGVLFQTKRSVLEIAVQNFLQTEENHKKLDTFVQERGKWLMDFALFMAIKEHLNYKPLLEWPDDIRLRKPETIQEYEVILQKNIQYHLVTQYFFFEQWFALKQYANKKNIQIIGDIPIYVSKDSVELWTQPELFQIDANNYPTYVAGCPADSFSPDGQLWGNPLYDWEYANSHQFEWWIQRLQQNLKMYDIVRLDHFKGFSDYWQIDAQASTAKNGTWQKGPDKVFFDTVKQHIAMHKIIAEDLGAIDEKTRNLLAYTDFPGMKVLQFGLESTKDNLYLPHHYSYNSIAYVGTHDNDTVVGWYSLQNERTKEFINNYLHRKSNESIAMACIRTIMASTSKLSIISMQDLLEKDSSARMNAPSTTGTNWTWRMLQGELTPDKKDWLKKLTILYARKNTRNDD